jgi:hypothetical protein
VVDNPYMSGRAKLGRMLAGLIVSAMAALAIHHYAGGGSGGASASLTGLERSVIRGICADQGAYNSTASRPGEATTNAQLARAIQKQSPAGAALLNHLLASRGGTAHLCPTSASASGP